MEKVFQEEAFIEALARAANTTPDTIFSRRKSYDMVMARAIGAAYYQHVTGAPDIEVAKKFRRASISPWIKRLEDMNLLNILSWNEFLFRLIRESRGPLISLKDLISVSKRERFH